MAKHSKLDMKTAEKVLETLDEAKLLSIPERMKNLARKARVKVTSKELGLACRKVRHEVYREVYGTN